VPERPDVVVYLERLQAVIGGRRIERVRVASPFVVRTDDPPIHAIEGHVVEGFRRVGKRLVLELGDEIFLVIHPMKGKEMQPLLTSGG
jgi:formamidopyrimidine-DNA glycosylase